MRKHLGAILILSVYLLAVVAVTPAQAYIDPGSGSMLLQLLLGGVAGVALALKMFWRNIMAFFGRHPKDEKEQPPADKP